MYVLQTHGKELGILARLEKAGLRGFVPRQIALIRRGGKWQRETQILFPGYVLLDEEYSVNTHLAVRKIDGVIRWLGQPSPLSSIEEVHMRLLSNGGEAIAPSKGYIENGKLVITSGILEGNLAGEKIISYNKRQRRAVLRLTLGGKSIDITLAVNIL